METSSTNTPVMKIILYLASNSNYFYYFEKCFSFVLDEFFAALQDIDHIIKNRRLLRLIVRFFMQIATDNCIRDKGYFKKKIISKKRRQKQATRQKQYHDVESDTSSDEEGKDEDEEFVATVEDLNLFPEKSAPSGIGLKLLVDRIGLLADCLWQILSRKARKTSFTIEPATEFEASLEPEPVPELKASTIFHQRFSLSQTERVLIKCVCDIIVQSKKPELLTQVLGLIVTSLPVHLHQRKMSFKPFINDSMISLEACIDGFNMEIRNRSAYFSEEDKIALDHILDTFLYKSLTLNVLLDDLRSRHILGRLTFKAHAALLGIEISHSVLSTLLKHPEGYDCWSIEAVTQSLRAYFAMGDNKDLCVSGMLMLTNILPTLEIEDGGPPIKLSDMNTEVLLTACLSVMGKAQYFCDYTAGEAKRLVPLMTIILRIVFCSSTSIGLWRATTFFFRRLMDYVVDEFLVTEKVDEESSLRFFAYLFKIVLPALSCSLRYEDFREIPVIRRTLESQEIFAEYLAPHCKLLDSVLLQISAPENLELKVNSNFFFRPYTKINFTKVKFLLHEDVREVLREKNIAQGTLFDLKDFCAISKHERAKVLLLLQESVIDGVSRFSHHELISPLAFKAIIQDQYITKEAYLIYLSEVATKALLSTDDIDWLGRFQSFALRFAKPNSHAEKVLLRLCFHIAKNLNERKLDHMDSDLSDLKSFIKASVLPALRKKLIYKAEKRAAFEDSMENRKRKDANPLAITPIAANMFLAFPEEEASGQVLGLVHSIANNLTSKERSLRRKTKMAAEGVVLLLGRKKFGMFLNKIKTTLIRSGNIPVLVSVAYLCLSAVTKEAPLVPTITKSYSAEIDSSMTAIMDIILLEFNFIFDPETSGAFKSEKQTALMMQEDSKSRASHLSYYVAKHFSLHRVFDEYIKSFLLLLGGFDDRRKTGFTNELLEKFPTLFRRILKGVIENETVSLWENTRDGKLKEEVQPSEDEFAMKFSIAL
eukprot:GHVP01055754.1.p1 GENE.GHVP01055754.1~~GHVP01055754.1.p1  ORF type:complete len:993 (+),score=195.40 GHVP01055754.1:1513-4491(+)